ncbi:MAG: hypothetical protein O2975_04480 [Proteobacteria bacterium]|nr:hypothetical protein [Pseudomonadota bacterium]
MRIAARVQCLSFSGLACADVRPGEWEIEAAMSQVTGAGGVPPVKQKQCLRAHDGASARAVQPAEALNRFELRSAA